MADTVQERRGATLQDVQLALLLSIASSDGKWTVVESGVVHIKADRDYLLRTYALIAQVTNSPQNVDVYLGKAARGAG